MSTLSEHCKNLISKDANAVCFIKGGPYNQCINGKILFYNSDQGTVICIDISGLPDNSCNIFGFHIHEGMTCTGNETDPFSDTGMHYNPNGAEHPCHAGDLPPHFSAAGKAFMVFLTNRFSVNEVIGKTVVIHSNADDFTTQPSGNSGSKIACGIIRRI